MPSMSISGIVSGVDWEGMITTMVEAAQKPAQVQINKRINLTNKKSLFEEMQELAEKLQKSTTALRLESTYKAKKVETERIDSSGSAKGVLTAKVNADAQAGVYTVKVNQLAQAHTRRGARIEGNSNDLLKDYAETTLWFTQNGQRTGVTISDDETLESLSSKINNTIKTLNNPMTFTASAIDGRLIIKSDEQGEGNVKTSNANAITYDGSGYTTLPVSVDIDNLSDGDFTITDGNKTYTYGTDFDIVDGNKIRWKLKDTKAIKAGDEYTLKYKAAVNDVYTTGAITRGSGNIDTSDAFNFTPNTDDITIADRFSITDSEGFTYKYGTDFDVIINTDDDGNTTRSIRWLKSSNASRPDEGVNYNINYTCGNTLSYSSSVNSSSAYSNVLRLKTSGSNVELTYDDIVDNLNASSILVTDGTTNYTYGTDFEIVKYSNSGNAADGYPRIHWLIDAYPTTCTVTYSHPIDGNETFDLDVTRGNEDSFNSTTSTLTGVINNNTATISATKTDTNGNINTTNYTQGSDFDLIQDDKGELSVKWLNDLRCPAAGDGYKLTIKTDGTNGENITLSGIKTNNDTDSLSATFTLTGSDGTKYYEGIDYTLTSNDGTPASIKWNANSTWLMPDPDETLTFTVAGVGGNATVYTATRSGSDRIALADYGFTQAKGSISSVAYGDTSTENFSDLGLSSATSDGGNTATFTMSWDNNQSSLLEPHSNLPSSGAKLTYTYRHATNKFQLDDEGSGLLQALGFKNADGSDVTDAEYYTEAKNAEIEIDGEEYSLANNELEYENDILNGVKMELKGTGTVLIDVTHDTDKAVENVQTFIDDFNVLMDWINIRSTEKQVNNISSSSDSEDTVSTLTKSSDEYNTSWGLLYGNSYLRSTKSELRQVVSQNFTFNFKERTSLKPVYGSMGYNGLKADTTLRITVGDRQANITITPDDTLQTIAAKINDTSGNDEYDNEAYNLHHDADGNQIAAITAKVVNDKLVISRGSQAEANNHEVSLSGSAALNALNLNYTYKGLYQIGIETTSDNYGISGQLDFSADDFREALEDNPDEVQTLMTSFAKQMDTYMKSMLNATSANSGTLKTQISNIDTQISSIDDYLKKFQDRIDRMEARLRTQYAAAEDRIAQLSQQASSVSSILSQMAGNNQQASQ